MDAGDVELSGAVDFNPNELGEKPKTQEVKNAETTVETASKPASIKEEDVRFYSDKISTSNNDMFVRVEGGERRKRAMKRREERERKEALREAKIANRREEAASKQVADSEKQLKKEQRRLIKEQRQQKRRARREKIFGWIKRHWYIFATAIVLVIFGCIVLGVIGSKLAESAKEDAEIRKVDNLVVDTKAIERRMWENADGQQPWTAIKEYDDMIARLDTDELRADAYIYRSRMLLNYVQTYETDDKDELIRIIKSDVEKAVSFNVSDRAVCWASKLGKTLGDLDFYNKYAKECKEWSSKNPQPEPSTSQGERVEGEREG